MLLRLESSDARFRTVHFGQGLNLLIADRTNVSTDTDTRNSVGKSSMIEIIHFLLGARVEKNGLMARKPLKDMQFSLTMDWPGVGTPVRVSRNTSNPSEVLLFPDVVTEAGKRRTDTLFAGQIRIPISQWVTTIERDLFALPAEHKGISGWSMLSFLARRAGDHAFNEPTRTFPQQSLAEGTANLAYLLGLDWNLAARYKDISAKESMRRRLRDAAKDPVFGRIVGRPSELRGQIIVRESRLGELKGQIDSFVIVPGFEDIQARADQLSQEITQSRTLDAADRRNVQDIEAALRSTVEPDPDYLTAAYQELGELVAERIKRRLDEVHAFHSSVLSNRRRYLQEELEATRARLEARRAEREAKGSEQADLLRALEQGGALRSLTSLQEQYARKAAELAALRNRYDAADALESSRTEIAQERSRLQSELNHDLRDRSETVNSAVLLYSEYASKLYGTKFPAYLEFSADPSNLRITPRIESDEGRGVGNMAIFCFDLAVSVTAHRTGRGPDFLIHDSHLFDGVDERQVQRALMLGKRMAADESLQYVVTMNSDDLAKVKLMSTDAQIRELDESIITPRLTDESPESGLLGFRF